MEFITDVEVTKEAWDRCWEALHDSGDIECIGSNEGGSTYQAGAVVLYHSDGTYYIAEAI